MPVYAFDFKTGFIVGLIRSTAIEPHKTFDILTFSFSVFRSGKMYKYLFNHYVKLMEIYNQYPINVQFIFCYIRVTYLHIDYKHVFVIRNQ